MHLDDQVMALVLLSKPGIIRFNQVYFQSLTEYDNHVLYEPVHFDDEIHHVLTVFFVRFDLMQLLEIICVCLQGQYFEQTSLTFIHDLIDAHDFRL